MILNKKTLLYTGLSLIKFANAYQNYVKCINPGVVALTFDDGPNITTEKVLDILKKENIKATFFVNGKNYMGDIRENPVAQDLIKREFNEGHIVASHTFSHPLTGITQLTDAELTNELKDLNDALYELIQVKPTFFRPPLGEYTSENEKVIEEQGFTANIKWNIDPLDWANKGLNPLETYTKVYKEILSSADPTTDSFIALNHDVYENTVVNLIPEVIKMVRQYGFTFVTMDECLGLNPYQDLINPYQDLNISTNNFNNNITSIESIQPSVQISEQEQQATTPIFETDVQQNLQKSGSASSIKAFSISTIILLFFNIFKILNII